MGLVYADLEDEKLSDQDKEEIKFWLDRAKSNDVWAKKIFKKVGILITSHPNNRPYLKACIDSHVKLGYWITLAYDNHLPEVKGETEEEIDYNRVMPAYDVMQNVDTFIMPHHQVWGGVLYPYFWLLKFGVSAMKDFEYIYCTNGDFILEKPEGFEELFKMMGDADVMTCGHDDERYANTAGFIIKTEAFIKVVKHFEDHFIPFEVYEKHTQSIGNAEGRLGRAITDLNLKRKIIDPPADDMLKVPGKGTWYETMGFRHIHSEHNHAYRNRGIPPHYKYLDSRFMGDEYNFVKKYWDSNDKTVLEDWWAKDG
jgi:hypothetical protein